MPNFKVFLLMAAMTALFGVVGGAVLLLLGASDSLLDTSDRLGDARRTLDLRRVRERCQSILVPTDLLIGETEVIEASGGRRAAGWQEPDCSLVILDGATPVLTELIGLSEVVTGAPVVGVGCENDLERLDRVLEALCTEVRPPQHAARS